MLTLFYRREGKGGRRRVERRFSADDFSRLLDKVKEYFVAEDVFSCLVIPGYSLLLERTIYLPFRRKRAVNLVLPEELSPLLSVPLSEYVYGFSLPRERRWPISVFLLPVTRYRFIRNALAGFRFRVAPADLVAAQHPAVSGRKKGDSLLALDFPSGGRLILFRGGRFVAGRSFKTSADEKTIKREKEVFLRTCRLPETLEPVVVRLPEIFARPFLFPRFIFRQPGPVISREKFVPLAGALALLLLVAISFYAVGFRREMKMQRDQAAFRLSEFEDPEATAALQILEEVTGSDIFTLLNPELSPLENLKVFWDTIPGELPLILDSLEADRERLVVRGALVSPGQVELLVKSINASPRFQEAALGELTVEENRVRFPLNIKVTPLPDR